MNGTAPSVPDELLRRALEFAAASAAGAGRRGPAAPLPPPELRRLARTDRPFPKRVLAQVREVLETADEFRAHVGAKATVAGVGEAGWLWLTRPDGWQDHLGDVLNAPTTSQTQNQAQNQTQNQRLQKQRDAAERARDRATAEAEAHRQERERLLAELAAAEDDRAALLARAVAAEAERDGAMEAARAARAKTKAARDDERKARGLVGEVRAQLAEARLVRDQALADRTAAVEEAAEAAEAAEAREAVRLARAAPKRAAESLKQARRVPLPIPGGLLEDSVKVAEHLVAAEGVLLVVDGYNVAKLRWPDCTLADQRELLLDILEALVARSGTRILVVFDGAEAEGVAVATTARRTFTVEFSPVGVIADHVIVARVEATPATRAVVVATNDRGLADRVRRLGANRITSEQLLAIACR